MAELAGASEAQIRKLGRWNNQAMEKCYLTTLPLQAMRVLAGFQGEKGHFYLPRMTLSPPAALQSMIFPEADIWLGKLERNECEPNIAAAGFLNLLTILKTVILQDSVIMKQKYPTHPIWTHCIFSSEEYIKFEDQLKLALVTTIDPSESLLQRAVPLLNEKIQNLHQDLKSSLQSSMGPLAADVSDLKQKFMDITSGRAPIHLNVPWNTLQSSSSSQQPISQSMEQSINTMIMTAAASTNISNVSLPVYIHRNVPDFIVIHRIY